MERNWTKRKLLSLFQGDVETVRQWQSQVGRFIYTWLYYQLNKDETQAATLTAQTLSGALAELSAFDPEQTTMYLWLKDSASRQLQAALLQWGVKTQRPWAWSEVPARVLDSLKRIRNEALAPDVAGCGAVMEMVQATLADLSEQDRDLLIRRYTRLDTVEHIAAELNLSSDKVNQQLYLARHAFRRGLFFLIQSSNPDVVEPAVSGGMELFESNLEVLLRSVNAAAAMSSDSAEQIKRAVLRAASEAAQNPSCPVSGHGKSKAVWGALVGAGILVLAVVILLWTQRTPDAIPGDDAQLPAVSDVTPDMPALREQASIDEDELRGVFEIGVRGDVAGLIDVLRTGGFVSQMTAAHYLAQFGDGSALAPLLEAQKRWYPDEPLDNPFLRAIEAIEARLAAALRPSDPVVVDGVATPVPSQELSPSEAAKPPLLGGHIVGFDGTALSGVQVALYRDHPAQGATAAIEGFSAVTDSDGRYFFETLPEGQFVVTVRDPQQRIAESRRMMWAVKDRPCVVDFGGSPVVSGAVILYDTPLAQQRLLLSDSFHDPVYGAFTAEVQTDVEGGFVFSGVPAGAYGLFTRTNANRWILLAQVEVASADVIAMFDPPAVTLTVQAGELPESLGIVAVSLRYSPDSSDTLAEWNAVRTEVDTVFAINRVIPGVYTLCVDFSNGVRTLRDVVVTEQSEQVVFIDTIPSGSAGMEGRFLSDWPEGLTLDCADPQLRISVMPEEDGLYALNDLPSAMYSLGAVVNGLFVPYVEFGLFEAQPAAFDPDPVQLAESRCPLYITVTDAQGVGLSGGQVWLAGSGGFFVGSPFGRGYFVAAPPGEYLLYAAFPDYQADERTVQLPVSTLRSPHTAANSQVIRLNR